MKITKEQFNQLSQLDRIEYRQRFSILKERYSGSVTSTLAWDFFIVFIATLMLDIFFQSYNLTGFFLNIAPSLIKIAIAFLFIGVILDLFMLYNYLQEKNKLESSYFKINIIGNKQ
jgi:hypothetical protein